MSVGLLRFGLMDIAPVAHGAIVRAMSDGVVVLDLHLPDVSGGTILQQIRAEPRLTHTQVILATADAAMADVYDAQADLVLIKPVSFSQLRDLATRLRARLA